MPIRSCVATMTRVAFLKLLVIVLMAFIICLPQFFTSDQAALSIDSPCFRLHLCLEPTGLGANASQTQLVRDTGGGPYVGCVNISACEGVANRTLSSIECFLCQEEMDLHSIPRNSSQSEQQLFFCCGNCTVQGHATGTAPRPNRTLATNSTRCNASLSRTLASKESWGSGRRVVWLVLILMVIILVIGSVVYKVHMENKGCVEDVPLLISVDQCPEVSVRNLNGARLSAILEETAFTEPN
ncbi:uncharacterized protein LOC133130311 isoform X3 [Conger conger]|uniref:uncharacterized protein LOC133130311 isoform X3 n=1 Tax=Conger conger TaxID=82655 RepID=UPI002A59DC96|nr:uncharacterized protein LOC133130311 isoform X3 [Conger conger]